MQEAKHINKSLSALGNVINALTAKSAAAAVISTNNIPAGGNNSIGSGSTNGVKSDKTGSQGSNHTLSAKSTSAQTTQQQQQPQSAGMAVHIPYRYLYIVGVSSSWLVVIICYDIYLYIPL